MPGEPASCAIAAGAPITLVSSPRPSPAAPSVCATVFRLKDRITAILLTPLGDRAATADRRSPIVADEAYDLLGIGWEMGGSRNGDGGRKAGSGNDSGPRILLRDPEGSFSLVPKGVILNEVKDLGSLDDCSHEPRFFAHAQNDTVFAN